MKTNSSPSADSTYLLENAGREAPARFSALSKMFDAGTIRCLEQRGITDGWHCLEVGGGGGSIAAWLGQCVGPTGRVLVTDIDPRFLESLRLPNVEARCHNIVTDPLPDRAFDLVHARLVLIHLTEREKVLKKLVASLKPGGWLIDEDFDSISLIADGNVSPREVLLKTQSAILQLFDERGVERRFGRLLVGRLRAHGLVEVGAEGRVSMWTGGSAGSSLMRANFEQLREALLEAHYVTQREFEEDIARLDDPDFITPSPILWSAWGRRPA